MTECAHAMKGRSAMVGRAAWRAGVVTALVVLLSLVLSVRAQSVTFTAIAESSATVFSEAFLCDAMGGTLVSDDSEQTHMAIVAAIRAVKPSGDYHTFLGGAVEQDGTCPDSTAEKMQLSLNCVWTWQTAPYDQSPKAFYQGNFRPPLNETSVGLTGSGALNGMPEYFARFNGGQQYPGARFGTNVLMFTYGAVANSWADNTPGPGFQYLADESARTLNFYATCRVALTSTSTSTTLAPSVPPTTGKPPTQSTSLPTSGAASSSSGGTSTAHPTLGPSVKPTEGNNGGGGSNGKAEGADSKGLPIGAYVGIALGVVAVIVVVVILVCCRRRIAKCCCGATTGRGAEQVSDPEDEDVEKSRSLSLSNESFTSAASTGSNPNTPNAPPRRRLSDANIPTTTPSGVRSDPTPSRPIESSHRANIARRPQSTGGRKAPRVAENNYVNGNQAPAVPPTQPLSTLSSDNRSVRSDESKRSFRQTRTVSFVE